MAAARAPTLILRNWPSNVPTFSKMLAAPAAEGTSAPTRPRTAMILLISIPPARPRLADDDESSALSAFRGIHGEDVDAADDVLAVARNHVPARLTLVGIVLLPA